MFLLVLIHCLPFLSLVLSHALLSLAYQQPQGRNDVCKAVLGQRTTLHFMSTTVEKHWSQVKDTASLEGGSQSFAF